jgi:hypothetical protein
LGGGSNPGASFTTEAVCALRATANNITKYKATNRHTDFETQKDMRLSSAIYLNGRWAEMPLNADIHAM